MDRRTETIYATAKKMKPTLYEFLGVPKDASSQEIESACIVQGERFRPDKKENEFNTQSQLAFWQIEEAHKVLLDPVTRADYDARLTIEALAEARERMWPSFNSEFWAVVAVFTLIAQQVADLTWGQTFGVGLVIAFLTWAAFSSKST